MQQRTHIRYLLPLAIVLAMNTSTTSAKSITSTSNDTTTNVRMLTPFTPQGINPKLKIIEETGGTCWSSSLVDRGRPNTWRCHANNTVYDPCFKNPVRNQNSVVCLTNPWSRTAVVIKLKTPLPTTKSQALNIKDADPWALELSNGKMCTLTTGPSINIAGMSTRYKCSSGDVIVGNVDRSSNRWQVFFLGNEDLHMSQTRVTAAWY